MKQRDWIVIGIALAIMIAGVGTGLGIRHGYASQRQLRGSGGGADCAALGQDPVPAAEVMPASLQQPSGQAQGARALDPNVEAVRPEAADQNEVARQILAKVRSMTPEGRRHYLQRFLEQERAGVRAEQASEVNRPSAAANAADDQAQNKAGQ